MDAENKNTALIFQGQTFDFRKEYEDSEFVRKNLHIFQRHSSINLRSVCEGTEKYDPLMRTMYEQPAIFAVSLLKAREYERHYHKACMGHSLGELASLTTAGVIESEQEGLYLVQVRGRACAEANRKTPGNMAVLYGNIDMEKTRQICETNGVYTANINIPGEQVVISGQTQRMSKACEQFTSQGLKVIPLDLGGMFHCQEMIEAEEKWRESLKQVRFRPPNTDTSLVMISTGNTETDPEIIKECVASQLTQPIEFEKAVNTLVSLDVEEIHEVATKKTLSGFIRKIRNRLKRRD